MNLEDLGRRAVACKHWRWMPGMLATDGWSMHRVISHVDGFDYVTSARYESDGCVSQSGPRADSLMPDLSDPATLGCLLHLVRQAWCDPDLSADRVSRAHDKLPDVWQVYVFHESGVKDVLSGRSEIEALVAALEAAP